MKTKLSSFSLIELLITLAMILILAGLLLPVLQRTRSKAMDLSCQNMEKQIALAASQYILDNDDWILPAQDVESTDGSHSWFTLLAGNRTMQEVYTPPYGIRYSKMARNRNLAVSRKWRSTLRARPNFEADLALARKGMKALVQDVHPLGDLLQV